ncbi:MAG TPA: twin-arginine translocase subunit TatC, partial [Candidatus Deferrimicrobiaceae bacterium]
IGTLVCYNWAPSIYRTLMAPLSRALPPESRFIFTELTEAFLTYFKIALWGGFLLGSPVIFYQIWQFVSPGLYHKERALVLRFAAWSVLALAAGIAFGYFVAIPSIFGFLLSFGRQAIVPMPAMQASLSLVIRILSIFGVLFELPLVLYLCGRGGILTPKLLRKGRKVAILGALVLAAVLTPPDVVSQLMVAVPICVLYEVGILTCAVGARRHAKAAAA